MRALPHTTEIAPPTQIARAAWRRNRRLADRAEVVAMSLRKLAGTARAAAALPAQTPVTSAILDADRLEAVGALDRLARLFLAPDDAGAVVACAQFEALTTKQAAVLAALGEHFPRIACEPDQLERWAQQWEDWAVEGDPGFPGGAVS
jgi:hypothetical protein